MVFTHSTSPHSKMGKNKRERKRIVRHQPLYDDIRSEQIVTTKGVRHKKQSRQDARTKVTLSTMKKIPLFTKNLEISNIT